MHSLIIQGQRGLFQLSDPRPVLNRSTTGPDEYTDAWSMDYEDDLTEGQAHPYRAGLILRRLALTEDVPCQRNPTTNDRMRPGIYLADATWEGSYDNSKPDKLLASTELRTLRQQWESFTETRLSWHAAPKYCTATATDNVWTCTAHGFANGRAIGFIGLYGSPGVACHSAAALSARYFVVNRTANTFQIAASPGGSVEDVLADTGGYVLPVEYLPGIAHAEMTGMFLDTVQLRKTSNDGWHTADCNYVGIRLIKPHHRVISVGGQQLSSSGPIQVIMPGGWSDARYTNWQLPKVEVIDTTLTTSAPATGSLPTFAFPPNTPPVQSLTFWGDDLVYNYPYGWVLQKSEMVDSLSSAITLHLQRNTYEYIPPIMLR